MRIIFCDVDGVLIPGSMFFVDRNAAFKRVFSPSALAILANLAKKTGSKVVMNTSHNYLEDEGYPHFPASSLRSAMINSGFPEELFHKNWRTTYGKVDWGNRYDAINEWIAGNLARDEECDWICFDDFAFTFSNERLILTKYDDGLTIKEYFKALDIFNIKHNNIIDLDV
jgi:hypothetical protein